MLSKLKELFPTAVFQRTGSNYICWPPVEDTDIDVLMYDVCSTLEFANRVCALPDFRYCAKGQYPDDTMLACRFGKLNIIYISDFQFYLRMAAAAEYCKAKNVLSKEERIYLHRTITGEADEKTSG